MADIFQHEIEYSEELEPTDEQSTAAEVESVPEILIEEPEEEESEDKSSKVTNELEVQLEIDNLYYFQSQTVPTFEELATSDYIHNRQIAAKKILESLQKAGSNQEELQSIISLMCKLSEDEESMVRSELVQHIPSIALFCQSHPSGLQLVIQQQLVPYTVKLLKDPNFAVRKLAQSALLVLLENSLIGQLQLSEWICPLISQLAMCESNLEEQRIEDVTLMNMMIPLLDKAMALKFFLEPYISLCCDQAFGIRTVCAVRFGTLCKIAGMETTELSLLPSFLNLCCDDMWGVRKACADVFVDVAMMVSLKTRKEVLPHIFINLLNDSSCYVENAALQSLGGFISSFADPLKTGCSYKDGKLSIDASFSAPADKISPQLHEDTESSTKKCGSFLPNELSISPEPQATAATGDSNDVLSSRPVSVATNGETSGPVSVVTKNGRTILHIDNGESVLNDCAVEAGSENTFNTFQYWRHPIPEVELDIDLEGGKATEIHVRAKGEGGTSEIVVHIAPDASVVAEDGRVKDADESSYVQFRGLRKHKLRLVDRSDSGKQMDSKRVEAMHSACPPNLLTFNNKKLVQGQEPSVVPNSSFSFLSEEEESCQHLLPSDQDIVPPQLLSKYTSIVEDSDYYSDKAMESCAYSFPAVAFTLGKKYWPCIRTTCKTIASNVRWTVRVPIAASLHDLARILGGEIVERDLLPIFLEYLNDDQEVKMPLVRHMPQFLEQLSPSRRQECLSSFGFFINGFDRSWRFRCACAEQFQPMAHLYTTSELYENFLPIAMKLLGDRVSAVRVKATELMALIIKLMYKDEQTNKHCNTLLTDLVATYGKGAKWSLRQLFVFLCDQLARQQSLPVEVYEEKILPHLFHLARDEVPNVRLAVARCIVYSICRRRDYLENLEHFPTVQLLSTVGFLVEDIDTDVRHIACLWYQFQKLTPVSWNAQS